MSKVKVIDYTHDGTQEVHYGTCDYCMSTGTVNQSNPRMTLNVDDKEVTIDMFYWDWGDYSAIYIENVVAFGEWLKDYDVPDYISDGLLSNNFGSNYTALSTLVYSYEDSEYEQRSL